MKLTMKIWHILHYLSFKPYTHIFWNKILSIVIIFLIILISISAIKILFYM